MSNREDVSWNPHLLCKRPASNTTHACTSNAVEGLQLAGCHPSSKCSERYCYKGEGEEWQDTNCLPLAFMHAVAHMCTPTYRHTHSPPIGGQREKGKLRTAAQICKSSPKDSEARGS